MYRIRKMNKMSRSVAFYTENHYICEVNNL